MSSIPQTTIEQWAVLRTVVETGGFAQAAEKLHKSQSSVSYAVARLQERLGIALLKVEGRKALLTEAGRALLADATPLIDDLARIEDRSRYLVAGYEPSIRLLVDSIFPRTRLFEVLTRFRSNHYHVKIDLTEYIRQAFPDPLGEPFDLAIAAWHPRASLGQRIMDIEFVAVAHRDHPLHRRGGKISQAALSQHLLVFIHGQGPNVDPAEIALFEGQMWQVNTVEAALEAVSCNLCFGWLPYHVVAAKMEQGELLPLPVIGATRQASISMIYSDQEQAGPATHALARLFIE